MAKVGSEERVALRRSDRSEGLRSECGRIEKVVDAPVADPRISNLIGAIVAAAVLRGRAIVVAMLLRAGSLARSRDCRRRRRY